MAGSAPEGISTVVCLTRWFPCVGGANERGSQSHDRGSNQARSTGKATRGHKRLTRSHVSHFTLSSSFQAKLSLLLGNEPMASKVIELDKVIRQLESRQEASQYR